MPNRPSILSPTTTVKRLQMSNFVSILGTLKQHLRITSSNDDELLLSYLRAAHEFFELETNRSILSQQITAKYSIEYPIARSRLRNLSFGLNANVGMYLPYPHANEITSFTYFDENDVVQTFDTDIYIVDLDSLRYNITFKRNATFPDISDNIPEQIVIRYNAGFSTDLSGVADSLRMGIVQLAATYFQERLSVSETRLYEVPLSCTRIIEMWRIRHEETTRQRAFYDYLDFSGVQEYF